MRDAGGRLGEGDALISDRAGVLVGVKTADCVPILLVDPDDPVVAAIHAGWRGSAENIVAAAVRELVVRLEEPSGKSARGDRTFDRRLLLRGGSPKWRAVLRHGTRTEQPSTGSSGSAGDQRDAIAGRRRCETSGNPGNAHSACRTGSFLFAGSGSRPGGWCRLSGVQKHVGRTSWPGSLGPPGKPSDVLEDASIMPRWRTSRPNLRPRSRAGPPAPGT